MLVDIILFTVLALGFGCIRGIGSRREIRRLGTPIFLVSKSCRKGEMLGSAILIAVWIGLFIYCIILGKALSAEGIMRKGYVILLGFMCGLALKSLVVTITRPTGLYQNGILTETKALKYSDVQKYSSEQIANRNVRRIVFVTGDRKNKWLALVLSEVEEKRVKQLLKAQKCGKD